MQQLEICRDHPDAETADLMIYVRKVCVSREEEYVAVAEMYAPRGSKREVFADEMVRAINAHDQLVAALKEAKNYLEVHDATRGNTYSDVVEALAAAGGA